MDDSEKRLLSGAAAGNEQAFGQLFTQYHQQLGRYIFRITNSRELTEEIVQEVFARVWVNQKALAEVRDFRAYLFVLSKNYTLNYLRKLTNELMLKNKWKDEVVRTAAHDPIPDVYYRLLDEAIDQLPRQQRKVYLLSRHERLKYAEIADKLNLSPETVKSYLKIATASITSYITSNLELIASLALFQIIS